METYAIIYFGAAMLAMCLVPIVSQLGKRLCLLDVYGPSSERQNLIPRIGGIVLVISTMALLLTTQFLNPAIGQSFDRVHTEIITLLIMGSFVFAVGLIDDLFTVSGHVKLICLILASLAICASGTTLKSISVGHEFVIETGLLAWPLTILWIVTITGCMSFIDGLDGLAGGIAAIVCGAISIMAILSHQTVMAILMLTLLGSVTGFMFFNWYPAKIFMGASGLMFLGFMIGAGSLVCQVKTYTLIGLMLPVIALGVPILDTIVSIMRRRILERRSISPSDQNHLYNRLLALGFAPRSAVLVFCAVTAVSASIGVLLLTARSDWLKGVSVGSLLLLYSLLLYLLRGRQIDIVKTLKHNWSMAREVRGLMHNFENAEVRMRDAKSLNAWWCTVCTLGKEMRFQSISLWDHRNGHDSKTCNWIAQEGNSATGRIAKMSFPMGVNGTGGWEIEASLWVDKCLELGGQQAMLLARLLDEFPVPVPLQVEGNSSELLAPRQMNQCDTIPPVGFERHGQGVMITDAPKSKSRTYIPLPLDILGIPVTPFKTYNHALECFENGIASNCKWFCAAVNPIKIHNAWHDPELKCLLKQVDILICDGMGVAWASRMLYGQKIERITGCDLFFELLLLASRKQWGVYLLGASAQSNTGACKALQAMHPGLNIVGSQDGYFEKADEVVKQINASGAKLLFVAMGSPKQEQWIFRHRGAMNVNLCMGVGGSFDVAAGSVKRAPRIFRITGTEYLFRLALEPRKRLSQQKLLANFMIRVISTRLSSPHEPIPTHINHD